MSIGFLSIIVVIFILVGIIVCFLVASKRKTSRTISDKEQLEWIQEYNKRQKKF